MKDPFPSLLINWYQQNARSLPWRGHLDPYAIWVSEIMLQQTRVDTVIPYFIRWMERFPTIQALAEASEREVLKAWEGLGYYSRARFMHQAAQKVMSDFGGSLPADYNTLRSLPGIGPYTAAAISSIAFNRDCAVVDGNVKRVLARMFAYSLPVNAPAGEKDLQQIANRFLPPGQAGEYNQAMMELGALVCLPRTPNCTFCPLASLCAAFAQNRQAELPVMKDKAAIPTLTVTAAILHQDGKVLIARRPPNGLLGGMWEFPGGKVEAGETPPQALARELCEELGIETEPGLLLGEYHHAYSHFRVKLFAFHTRLLSGQATPLHHPEILWVTPEETSAYPMGKIDRMISRDLIRKEEQHG